MSDRNTFTSFNLHSQTYQQKLNDPLNELENISVSVISKTKAEEIKRLMSSARSKHDKYKLLQQYDSKSDLPAKIVKKELLEKYVFNVNCHDYNPEADILFGLSEIDVDGGASTEKFGFSKEDHNNIFDLSKSMIPGFHEMLHFPPKLTLKKIEVVKAMLSLHNEAISTLTCLEKCKLTMIKVLELLFLKQQAIIKTAEAYLKGLASLYVEAQLLKFKILKDYFSEDEGVVEASFKLREAIASEFENLKWKEIELQTKIEGFKKLESPKFDQLLREYKVVCESIKNKEWTLDNIRHSN